MAAESIRVTRSVVLPLAEVELQVSRSSGPGGQHAQKSETRAVAVFDVAASSALTERQKQTLLDVYASFIAVNGGPDTP